MVLCRRNVAVVEFEMFVDAHRCGRDDACYVLKPQTNSVYLDTMEGVVNMTTSTVVYYISITVWVVIYFISAVSSEKYILYLR